MRRPKHKSAHRARRGLIATIAVLGCSFAIALGCMGYTFATAHDAQDNAASFGIRHSANENAVFDEGVTDDVAPASDEGVQLASTAPRDITQGIEEIAAEERSEEHLAIARADEHRQAYLATYGALPAGDVDFSVGREAFIAEWTDRINAYLEGYPLAGHGEDFARAAWNYGIDPRWSPAISNTESGRGTICFLPYNAWGWGATGFSNWSQAIDAHVHGLANGYAFTIAYPLACKYCPPNCDNWYRNTLGEMKKI